MQLIVHLIEYKTSSFGLDTRTIECVTKMSQSTESKLINDKTLLTKLKTHNNMPKSNDQIGGIISLSRQTNKENTSQNPIFQTPSKAILNIVSKTNYNTPSLSLPPSTVKKANPNLYTQVADSIVLRKKQLKKRLKTVDAEAPDVVEASECRSPSLKTWKELFGS